MNPSVIVFWSALTVALFSGQVKKGDEFGASSVAIKNDSLAQIEVLNEFDKISESSSDTINVISQLINELNPDLSTKTQTDYANWIYQYSHEYGIKTSLLTAVLAVESRFVNDSESHAGASCMAGIMPEQAKYALKELGYNQNLSLKKNPQVCIEIGAYYLSELKTKYKTDEKTLGFYNGGYRGLNPQTRVAETRKYIPKVLDYKYKMKELLSQS